MGQERPFATDRGAILIWSFFGLVIVLLLVGTPFVLTYRGSVTQGGATCVPSGTINDETAIAEPYPRPARQPRWHLARTAP